MSKKLVTLLLATSMLVASAGCGKTEDTGTPTGETGKESVASQAGETINSEADNEEPVLKILLCVTDGDVIEKPEDMQLVQELDAKIGVKTEWECVKQSDWDTQLNLIMASGEYPDIIFSRLGKVDVEEYGVDQGILRPVDDLVEQYLDNYTDRIAMSSYDPTLSLKASDGQRYTVGFLSSENISTWCLHFINQAWLDALNLETPNDVDSLTDVLRAFKQQDPNGNGEADEIPLTFVMDTTGTNSSSVGFMLPLFGIPFGGANRWLFVDDNKNVQFIPTQDGFRECMEWLNTCYTEGLLDVEAFSQDGSAITRKLGDNVVGFFTNWNIKGGTVAAGAGKDCVLYVPGEGASIYNYLELASPRAYITSTNEHLEETMQWMNEYLETETMFSFYRGRQNQEKDTSYAGWFYNEDGKIESMNVPEDLAYDWLGNMGLYFAPAEYFEEVTVMSELGMYRVNWCDEYEASGKMQKYSNDYLKMATLSSEDAQNKILLETDINNAVSEYMAKFIMNGVTDDNWKEFVDILGDMGADKFVQMHQDALDKISLN